jgi:hypothetical protein
MADIDIWQLLQRLSDQQIDYLIERIETRIKERQNEDHSN